jgi:hypothetical protein
MLGSPVLSNIITASLPGQRPAIRAIGSRFFAKRGLLARLLAWTKWCTARDNEDMVKSVEGIYRNGKVELVEPLAEAEGSRVIVTWVHPAEPVDLREREIAESQAADLRRRLTPFAEDWDRPEMAAYDELPPR